MSNSSVCSSSNLCIVQDVSLAFDEVLRDEFAEAEVKLAKGDSCFHKVSSPTYLDHDVLI